MEIITESAQETKDLGRKIAADLKGGETLALIGDLGSGKTTFVQGITEGLGIKGRTISPTFILMRRYTAPKFDFYHIDLYRLEDNLEEEVKNLGLEDVWGDENNVVVIEWAEKIKDILPGGAISIKFKNLGGDKRKIISEDL
ncbi:MAG: tRNA (adenosine(37)-N6)-threonylcarbamoyltransferase complex ATPase subunit type 1 TsaE [Patescibacteria group bacterium]